MYKASVRERFEFNLDSEEIKKLDIIPLENGKYHLNLHGKLFSIELLEYEPINKIYNLKVNGHKVQVDVDDKYELLVRKMGMDKVNQHHQNKVNAPMPGMVSSIPVAIGDVIEEGTPLLILEAMKMENVLKSPSKGIIRHIHVKSGQAVEKNTLLIELE